jgi:hypothetical protein
MAMFLLRRRFLSSSMENYFLRRKLKSETLISLERNEFLRTFQPQKLFTDNKFSLAFRNANFPAKDVFMPLHEAKEI